MIGKLCQDTKAVHSGYKLDTSQYLIFNIVAKFALQTPWVVLSLIEGVAMLIIWERHLIPVMARAARWSPRLFFIDLEIPNLFFNPDDYACRAAKLPAKKCCIFLLLDKEE